MRHPGATMTPVRRPRPLSSAEHNATSGAVRSPLMEYRLCSLVSQVRADDNASALAQHEATVRSAVQRQPVDGMAGRR